MSISDKNQNLDHADFEPEYGSDNNGIQYSCGHINPLQKVLKNNAIKSFDLIKNSLQTAICEIEHFEKQILGFAKVRCEDVRSINRELRDALDNSEPDYDYYYDNCPHCEYIRDERDSLEIAKFDIEQEMVALKDQNKELSKALLESNVKIQELFHSFKNLETL
jgi:hypothetical protein